MTHLFRPSEPARVLTPPVGTCEAVSKGRSLRGPLARAAQLLNRHHVRRGLCIVLLLAGMVAQVVLWVLVAELVHLTVALMEVWVELAAKHTRILQ